MTGLKIIPSQRQFIEVYETLHFSKVSEKDVILWSQWARLDPRLAEILIQFLNRAWTNLNPLVMNQELVKQPWPAAFGVLLEQLVEFGEIRRLRPLFEKWAACVMAGIGRSSFQQFFMGQRALGGRLMVRESFLSLLPYLRWGFLGNQVLFPKYKSLKNKTLISSKTRAAALDELRESKIRFTVNDYIEFLNGHVSRRQAQLDLKNARRLSQHGNTRSRNYK